MNIQGGASLTHCTFVSFLIDADAHNALILRSFVCTRNTYRGIIDRLNYIGKLSANKHVIVQLAKQVNKCSKFFITFFIFQKEIHNQLIDISFRGS